MMNLQGEKKRSQASIMYNTKNIEKKLTHISNGCHFLAHQSRNKIKTNSKDELSNLLQEKECHMQCLYLRCSVHRDTHTANE